VGADSAGVLFTANPVSGDSKEFTITASWGLGESVVSGEVDPDTIVMNLRGSEPVVSSIVVGRKGTRLDLAAEAAGEGDEVAGGVQETQAGEDEAGQLCLQDHVIAELCSLGRSLVELYGCAQDIEFAVLDNEIFLLQSRPITTMHRYSEWDIAHEYDTAWLSGQEIWTRANLGEVLPGALTPLTRSTIVSILDKMLQRNTATKETERFYTTHGWSWLQTREGHTFLDLINSIFRWPEQEINIVTKAIDFAVFGHQITTDEILKLANSRHGAKSDKFNNSILVRDLWNLNRIHIEEKAKFMRSSPFSIPKEATDPLEVLAAIDNSWDILARISYLHIKNSEISSALQMILFLVKAGKEAEWTPALLHQVSLLLTLDDCTTESAGVPQALNSLHAFILDTEGYREEFASVDVDQAEVWLRSRLSQPFSQFLEKFGHRCLKEFELSSQPWRIDASPIVGTLQAMVNSNNKTPANTNNNNDNNSKQTETSIIENIVLKILIPYAHRSILRREESKSMLIKLVDNLRSAYLHLATTLVQSGMLRLEEDVFYLTHHELHCLVHQRKLSIVQRVGRRRRQQRSLNDQIFPEFISRHHTHSEAQVDSDVEYLCGTPACAGQVKGKARVITKLEEAKSIQPGEILVTISTDIGWTPYFPMLAGVITELGGLISHGAVVAREYGIPCLVGTSGATAQIKTGTSIHLDTYSGRVYIK